MSKYKINVKSIKILADTITPVGVYLKIRDRFPKSIMLESSEYNSKENSFSFICFNPIASFKVENEKLSISYPDDKSIELKAEDVFTALNSFINVFETVNNLPIPIDTGLFGYMAYNSIQYIENIEVQNADTAESIPDVCYYMYKHIIAINHFNNEAHIIANCYNTNEDELASVLSLIRSTPQTSYEFALIGEETSSTSEIEFKEGVNFAKEHCAKGDVFQMVLSRRFRQQFSGDDFNVYRTLRSVNPSPYLFYFDFGDFRLFGSSPESQIVSKDGKVTVHPIAGTVKKTGDALQDFKLTEQLLADPKENSEHTMLVDLARNDLNRKAKNVKVESYKTVQQFSHVIHMVSTVTGEVKSKEDSIELLASTFPAGTLSGAPKVKAMELINYYEKESRGFYGGCVGFIGLNGDLNHAIMIRSIMSKDNRLHYQAGAGIVIDSVPENELQEVDNKLGALRSAISKAKNLNSQPQKS
ncbi:MAG: anthranilate synthase component I family protein [Flavobacteriales bacterium]|nr:anthranilate synthase component I family protein [Flavobacteriales bacterium]